MASTRGAKTKQQMKHALCLLLLLGTICTLFYMFKVYNSYDNPMNAVARVKTSQLSENQHGLKYKSELGPVISPAVSKVEPKAAPLGHESDITRLPEGSITKTKTAQIEPESAESNRAPVRSEVVSHLSPNKFGSALRAPPIKRHGRFAGSTGQHKFYHAKARDWYVDPDTVKRLCRETNFTQCNPPARRTEQEKQADRAAHSPFKVVVYKQFDPDPSQPRFSECNYNNCVYAGRTVTQETDAVFVYGVGLRENYPLPGIHLPHQVFIFSTFEPPSKRESTAFSDPNSKWRHFFNATMTYRLDSDIRFSYGKLDFQLKEPKDLPDYRAIARKKTRTAIWIVSNCGAVESGRMPYVREMQKYIDIDLFGMCGEKCEVNDERCIADLGTTYRFYLAFENSYCTDYLTEKFFKLFIDDMHIIPVVRGDMDYNREFPERTFVNAANFKGPKELALFLKSLEDDELEFSKYLETKDRYRSVDFGNRWCWVCEYLQKLQGIPYSSRHKTIDMRKEFFEGHVHSPPTWQH